MIATFLMNSAGAALSAGRPRRLTELAVLMAACLFLSPYFFGTVQAQSDASDNLNRIKLMGSDLPGYTLVGEVDRDWSVYDVEKGAPADCLKSKPLNAGREQVWRIMTGEPANGAAELVLRPSVRVDYGLFDSPGQAASAARQAALLISSATDRMDDGETIGDASWRTLAGSPALIVQRGAAVVYISAQGESPLSEAALTRLAQTLAKRIDAIKTPASLEGLACDVETYIGLGMVSDRKLAGELRTQARQLSNPSERARALEALKSLAQNNSGKGMDRATAANLVHSAQLLVQTQ